MCQTILGIKTAKRIEDNVEQWRFGLTAGQGSTVLEKTLKGNLFLGSLFIAVAFSLLVMYF